MVDATPTTEQTDAANGRFHINAALDEQPVVVQVSGELDITTAPLLDEQLRAAEAVLAAPAPVVLDLSGVTFLASAGLSVLVRYGQRFSELGSQLRVVATDRAVTRPITMTGLDDVVSVYATEDEARAA
jgi:anti-sigma B factor antagonist